LAATDDDKPGTVVLVVRGTIGPGEIPQLCVEALDLLEQSGADVVVCDVSGVVDSDVGTIDALARLALTLRRLGRRVQLRDPCPGLRALVVLTGLDDVLPVGPVQGGQEARPVEE
jgi:anti-anti-sigma regulatory factor